MTSRCTISINDTVANFAIGVNTGEKFATSVNDTIIATVPLTSACSTCQREKV
jgi:hypothetical protein